MSDKDRPDETGTFVPDFHFTSTNRVLMEEITEGSTVVHQYPLEKPTVSWVRRLLNWFKDD